MDNKKPNGYWTKERCKEEALKYKSRTEFYKNAPCAYTKSSSSGWLDVVCSHMPKRKKRESKWTKELCKKEALKYDIKTQFHNKSNGAFVISRKNKWLDEICLHMKEGKKPNGYWSKERCHEEALKYDTRTEFQKKSNSAYSKAIIKNWIDDICTHMVYNGNLYKRCIYSFEFEDKYVYVGLTHNIEKRKNQHLNNQKSQVKKHIQKHNIKYKFIQLTQYLDIGDAINNEELYLKKYITDGWKILNISKTGGLGGNKHKILKWDEEQCREEALKWNIKYDFKKNSPSAYTSARKNGWLDDICSHMTSPYKPNGYWNFKRCQEEALKYDTRTIFNKQSKSAYNSAYKNMWLDDICLHMKEGKKPSNYWTKERCQEEALNYNTKKEFRKNSYSAYSKAKANNWLGDICLHMTDLKKPPNYWTYDRCNKLANTVKTKTEFRKKSNSAYNVSYKNNWLNDFFPKK